MNVSVVIPTRGNVELDSIIASLPEEWEIVIWDNSKETDLGVYGRYAAIERASHDIVFTQDDDCIVPARTIVDAYEPGRLVANMPESRWKGYPDSVMVGWGAVFDRDLPQKAFDIFAAHMELGVPLTARAQAVLRDGAAWFERTCDIVFSALTPRTVIDVGFAHLPWAEGPGRMWTSNKDHGPERDRMVDLCRQIRTWPDDDRRIPA